MFRNILDQLDAEYRFAIAEGSKVGPLKQSIVLDTYGNDTPSRYANTMSAVLSTGEFGSKTIVVDEITRKMTSRTLLFNSLGDPIANMCSAHLTRIRCGFMAALCCRYYYQQHQLPPKVAILGFGRIGKTVLDVLAKVLDDTATDWMFKESREAPLVYLDEKRTPADLSDADLVITCTSEWDKAARISSNTFKHKSLVVSFDLGYFLDRSFRQNEQNNFSDCPSHVRHNFHEEFPWDWEDSDGELAAPTFAPLFELTTHDAGIAVAYIYGMAFSDLIMSLHSHDLIPYFASHDL